MSKAIEELISADADYLAAASRLFNFKKSEGFVLVALHLYRQPDGSILYGRVRMHKLDANGGHEKFVRPFWNDGAGWMQGEPKQGGGKLLYGLPELSAHPDAPVFVTEGEQKADELTQIGVGRFVGVTSGSATSAGGADWSPLAGRQVILWPDNDDPGTKYADEVSAKLAEHGCMVERIDVAALDLPSGGDVMNWLPMFDATHGRKATAEDVLMLPKVVTQSDAIETADAEPNAGDAAPTDTDDEAIARLAVMTPMQYDRARKDAAKRLRVQVSTLDKMVKAVRGNAKPDNAGPFAEVEPWHEQVDGGALLSEIARTIRRFIVCDESTVTAAVLWTAMTWLMDSVDVAPLAIITAPEKRCGKSQLLDLLGRLSRRPLLAGNVTAAALFRAIEAWQPTLLIDEADAFMRENEELRGVLNAGHTRSSAFVLRTVGEDHMPKQFNLWGAKAIAGIGRLADTLMDRSITLELQRKRRTDHVDKLRDAGQELFGALRAKLARWAEDNAEAVRRSRPAVPDALHDRAADNWDSLLRIADVAGGMWPQWGRAAALKISGGEDLAQSTGTELLSDIQEIFQTRKVQRISMADLVGYLCDDEEKPWATWRSGKPMNARDLGKMLSDYGIKSKAVRIGYESPKGFDIDQFHETFARYLSFPSATAAPSVTRSHPNVGAGIGVTEVRSRDWTENHSVTLPPLSDEACDRVTEATTDSAEGEKSVIEDDEEAV
ncbi:DUF3631 domain-containing protein [Burkholderia vietnamiensis]|uniref:DUF3631 domain-containing protein n=1 Tax=Burkholderia vietnamiensis TaxID=60552 RepID=UPI001CF47B10|nr:DUF3631 domain-containing protein [Burkholderia vietnamiensis]MCA8199195.1 DUF3631 domain-containing protein [Burkholderia vietnamiensis]